MSSFVPLPITPAPIPEQKFSRTGDVSMGPGLRRIAAAYSYVSANQRKHIITRSNFPATTPATTSENNHYFVFRTGANVESVDCIIGLRTSAAASSTNAAYCELVLYDGTNTLTSAKAFRPQVSTSSVFPQWSRLTLTATDDTLLPNTEYRGYITQAHYCVVESFTVFETAKKITDSTVAGVCDPLAYETNKPIYDADIQDLAECGNTLYRHNAVHLYGWSRGSAATAPTVSSTTAVNLFDTSVTAWAATSPGIVLNTQYHNTYNGSVNIVLGCLATRTVGTTDSLTITVVNSGGTIITRTCTPSTMSPFDSSTYTITAAAADKVDIYVASTGTDTWRIDALGLWEYEA